MDKGTSGFGAEAGSYLLIGADRWELCDVAFQATGCESSEASFRLSARTTTSHAKDLDVRLFCLHGAAKPAPRRVADLAGMALAIAPEYDGDEADFCLDGRAGVLCPGDGAVLRVTAAEADTLTVSLEARFAWFPDTGDPYGNAEETRAVSLRAVAKVTGLEP